jgi:hypothetical protein
MAFTGKATYDNFALVGEDVADLVALLGPSETPFLSLLSAGGPATSTYHQWTEEQLGPNTLIVSTAVNSATAATGATVNGSLGTLVQVGMLLKQESGTPGVGDEIVQITSVVGANSILFARGKNGVYSSLAVGGTLTILGAAALEGEDVVQDVTRKTTRVTNVTQIFKKDIIVSGSDLSMTYAPAQGDMFTHQSGMRLRECLRDLEKTIIRGAVVNSIATNAITRSMDGLEARLTTVNSTIATASFSANPVLYVNDLWQQAWNQGARDIDLVLVGATWKRAISGTNASVLSVDQSDTSVRRVVETFQGDFGSARVVLSPWMAASGVMLLANSRVVPVPLQGRSFQVIKAGLTGDSQKGFVVGEYTVEIRNANAMAYGHV